jgi:methionyl-tRNA synthetase
VNARPHLGHAYSTIVCDAIARRKRALGIDTWFLTGTDEHGQKIERSASWPGARRMEFATPISAEFRGLWDRLGLTYDDFIRTTEERHKRGVQRLFATLRDRASSTRARIPANIASPMRLMWTALPARFAPIAGASRRR